ncbi:MAG TPA: TAXI family TRAP transporter solute-binding subunit [Firmicutes bacterium]|nr:TAXI family TRAP transporter solute-binding subunit [Bacillota bacterium]
MRKDGWQLGTVLCVALLLLLTAGGCAPKPAAEGEKPAEGEKQETTYLTFASGSVGGAYYPLGGGIADVLSELPGIQCVSESTGASIENGRLVASGESQMGFMMGDAAFKAVQGIDPFKEKLPLKALFSMYPAPEHIVTLKNSGINSVEDLKGKRVSVDAPGSGCEAMAKEILKAYGMTYDDIEEAFLSQPEAATALKDGTVDAVFWNFAYPGAVVMDVASARDIKMIPIKDEILDKLTQEFPYYVKGKIPAGTYKGVDEDIAALEVGNAVVVREDMPEDLAYTITKTLYENVKRLAEIHPVAAQMTPESGWRTPIELHPGAAKYFREVGVLK